MGGKIACRDPINQRCTPFIQDRIMAIGEQIELAVRQRGMETLAVDQRHLRRPELEVAIAALLPEGDAV